VSLRSRRRKELEAKLRSLRKQLRINEAAVVLNDKLIEDLTEEALPQIEGYVDALAQLASAVGNEKISTAPQFEEDPEFFELLVGTRWHGVDTVEKAREELAQEVARRSVGKTDLALLLSSIDHAAYKLRGTELHPALAELHGKALVEAAVESLTFEALEPALVADENWSTMRRRWVLLGWRSSTEENFNSEYVRAVAERIAEIHDAPATKDRMIEAFRLRLEREYEALSLNTVLNDELNKLPPGEREEGFQRFRNNLNREYDKILGGKIADGSARVSPSTKPHVPYSDHELMRQGRGIWETSYAKGFSDEDLRTHIASFNTNSPIADETAMFAGKWAVHAFQRLMTSHTFAAALMCSDVQRDVLLTIEKQWDAFLVIVPNGMLVVSGLEFSRILVATYSFGARMILLTTGGPEISLKSVAFTGTVADEAATLADLLVSEGDDLEEDMATKRCLVMAKRLVAGLLLNLQDAGTHKVRNVDARPKSKKREAEPEHRIVTIGAPIEIDCRAAVKEYIEHGTRSSEKGHRRHGTPTVQWMVRGHFRMQAHGPRHSLRRKLWIHPFWKGDESMLIQTRARAPK
jgi:hypothetical protein